MPKYISIIGSDLVEPLVVLLEGLIDLPQPDTESGIVGRERGFCASICLLTVVIIESFAMRARYLNESDDAAKQRTLHKFIDLKYPGFEWSKELIEVFILRDVIAHNHLWELESSDSAIWIDLLNKELHSLTLSFSDSKYKKYVDKDIGRTKFLCLHVIPTQIDRTDVTKVLKIARRTLGFLGKEEGPILGVEGVITKYKGEILDLDSIFQAVIKTI